MHDSMVPLQSSCFPREERGFRSIHTLFEAIVRAHEPESLYDVHLNVVICNFAFMLPPEVINAQNDVKSFWAF